MSLVKKLTPINLQEEKAKFLADQSYEPQFVYAEEIDDSMLNRYGKIDQKILDIAEKIINKAFAHRNQKDLRMIEGPIVSQDEVEEQIKNYLKLHGLEKRFKTSWSQSYIARTTITSNLVKMRLPSTYRRNELWGMMYHEIGTHALRRINYEKQQWYKKKNKYGFSNYLKTEEGLASLHSLIPKNVKLAHAAALKYYFAETASSSSFSELFGFVNKYIQNFDSAWAFCVRMKRGIKDTSKSGFNSKSLVYLGGMVEVWQWLNNNNFDFKPLYFGKISCVDAKKAVDLNPNFKPILPKFIRVSNVDYPKIISEIGKQNYFDDL